MLFAVMTAVRRNADLYKGSAEVMKVAAAAPSPPPMVGFGIVETSKYTLMSGRRSFILAGIITARHDYRTGLKRKSGAITAHST
jgi:hypothetical protein